MRFLVWNTEKQKYECSECCWREALRTNCNDPAETLELHFSQHRCEEYQQKAAA